MTPFHLFDLVFYCFFFLLFNFLSPFIFPFFFTIVLYFTFFFSYDFISTYPNLLENKMLVIVVVYLSLKLDKFSATRSTQFHQLQQRVNMFDSSRTRQVFCNKKHSISSVATRLNMFDSPLSTMGGWCLVAIKRYHIWHLLQFN
jgi:hypothetical protein